MESTEQYLEKILLTVHKKKGKMKNLIHEILHEIQMK